MRTEIKFQGIIVLIIFCLLNYFGCGKESQDFTRNSSGKKNVEEIDKVNLEKNVEQYMKALNDPSSKIRAYAARALGELKALKAVKPLIKVLKDKEESVRMEAAWALGELKSTEAVGPLLQLLKETDPEVYGRVDEALIKIRGLKQSLDEHDHDGYNLQIYKNN